MTGWMSNTGLAGAFVLGLLTSLQPCVLATAAGGVTWSLGWDQAPRAALVRGLALVCGLCTAYAVLALAAAHLAQAETSPLLGATARLAPFQGPLMLAAGALVTGLFGQGLSMTAWGKRSRWGATRGAIGSFAAGLVLAAFFCPGSAGIFFLVVIPSAMAAGAPGLYAASYGAGMAAPMLAVVLAAAFGGRPGRGAWRLAGMIRLAAGATLMLVGGARTVRLVIQTVWPIIRG